MSDETKAVVGVYLSPEGTPVVSSDGDNMTPEIIKRRGLIHLYTAQQFLELVERAMPAEKSWAPSSEYYEGTIDGFNDARSEFHANLTALVRAMEKTK